MMPLLAKLDEKEGRRSDGKRTSSIEPSLLIVEFDIESKLEENVLRYKLGAARQPALRETDTMRARKKREGGREGGNGRRKGGRKGRRHNVDWRDELALDNRIHFINDDLRTVRR